MWRFIIVTFGFLAFAFYELSGGADFDAEATRLARIELPVGVEEDKLERVVEAAPVEQPIVPENVTRVSLNLNSVNDVLRPRRNFPTTPARQLPSADDTAVTDGAMSEEEPTIILPSLIMDTAVITPVDFNAPRSAEESGQEVREVTARNVNVRGGPGTNFSVVNKLTRGDAVEILQDPGNGWVKLRPVGGGTVGWMADFLLSEG